MKIVCINKNMYKIYLNKYYYQFDKNTISNCIKNILILLKKIYKLEIYSKINIKCYINDNYGIILEIDRIYDTYCLYTKKSNIEMICYYNSKILYEIDDYFIKENLKSYNFYKYYNKYYLELLEDEYLKIIEFTNKIVYGEEVNNILNNNC